MLFTVLATVLAAAFAQDACVFNSSNPVVHLPQEHWVPDYHDDQDTIDRVARSQFEIAHSILKDKRAVFYESLYADLTIEDVTTGPSPTMTDAAIMIFPEGLPNDFAKLNPLQREFLAKEGGAKMLLYLGKVDRLRKVYQTQEQSDAIDQKISTQSKKYGGISNALKAKDPVILDLIFKQREAAAATEITSYLKANPGKKTTVIFGGLHDFSDEFPRGFERARCHSEKSGLAARSSDCEKKLEGSGLETVLKKIPTGWVFNRSAPGLKSFEKVAADGLAIEFVDPATKKLRHALLRFGDDGKISAFLLQGENFEHIARCSASASRRAGGEIPNGSETTK